MENTFELDRTRIPESIAIIMDGNGRWAKQKGMPRMAGHAEGGQVAINIVTACKLLGVKHLTLYTFSKENWNRPQEEVDALMKLIVDTLEDKIFIENNVRFRVLGDISPLPEASQRRLKECMANTANNTDMTLVAAVNYSSRWEISMAMQQAVREAMAGKVNPEDIDEQFVTDHMQTNYMPDPDLVIRTGGELRISNFLLWQSAYSEFYFTDTFWPDFTEEHLYRAIADYQHRQRRFGKTGDQVAK